MASKHQIREVYLSDPMQWAAITQLRDEGIALYSHAATPHTRTLLTPADVATMQEATKAWLLASPETRMFLDTDGASEEMIAFCVEHRIPYSGGTEWISILEDNRRYARSTMRSVGIPLSESFSVENASAKFRVLEDVARRHDEDGTLFVIKADYDMPSEDWLYYNVFIPDTLQEFTDALLNKYAAPLSIEEKVEGIEVAFTVVVVDDVMVPLHTNFEHKRTHTGNLGVNIGESGTLCIRGIAPKVLEMLFEPMQDYFLRHPYRGYLDINCIYEPVKRRLVPLEFTPRWGIPTHSCFSEMVHRPGQLLLDWGCGIATHPTWRNNASACLLIVGGGYPFPNAVRQGTPVTFDRPFVGSRWTTINLKPDAEYGFVVNQGRQGILACGGSTVADARAMLYHDVEAIIMEDIQYRIDIGAMWESHRDILRRADLLTAEQACL